MAATSRNTNSRRPSKSTAVKKASKKAQTKKATKKVAKKSAAKKAPVKREAARKPSTITPVAQKGPRKNSTRSKAATNPAEVDAHVLEFIAAIDRYKKKHNRPFPSWSEVLQIVRALGYSK